MLTLDEVIKAFELCDIDNDGCTGCPYDGSDDACQARNIDALHYLKNLKAKSEEPPLGNPPDYISLGFHQLAEMIGEPVYIKDRGCKGHWEIITAVRKILGSEEYAIKGNDRWQRIGNCIYRTKEGAAKQQSEQKRIFLGIDVSYPTICTYPEYEGKPYYAIKYLENGEAIIGFGTYNPDVLSEYLRKYFIM